MDNTQQIFPAFRLVAQFADGQRLTFDGLTGDSMTWDASGAVSKAPKAVVIKDGAYAAM